MCFTMSNFNNNLSFKYFLDIKIIADSQKLDYTRIKIRYAILQLTHVNDAIFAFQSILQENMWKSLYL